MSPSVGKYVFNEHDYFLAFSLVVFTELLQFAGALCAGTNGTPDIICCLWHDCG